MRKVAGGDEQAELLWTREGTYQGVHYVFDRAGDMVRKGSPGGGDASDLELIWDANHRLAESRRGGKSTHYGYDPLGRRVFKRNPDETTRFFWDGDALLGEVKQANDAEDAAPVWVDNVASLIEVKRRQRRLGKLHEGVREYVYYPGSFVPLALLERRNVPGRDELECRGFSPSPLRDGEGERELRQASRPVAVHNLPGRQPAVEIEIPVQKASASASTPSPNGLGTLGSLSLSNSKRAPNQSKDAGQEGGEPNSAQAV